MKRPEMKLARRRAAGRGYTIIELMFSLVIFLFCIVALLNALSDSMYHYTVQADYAIMQMDARRALETIARDVRMAGHIEDPSSGIEYPYTFTNGQPRLDFAQPAVHAAPAQHVAGTSAAFGDNREISYKVPVDNDGDGFITDADTGLIEWSNPDISLVLVTSPTGINQLQRWENGLCTEIVANYVERVTFDTIRTDPTIDWNGIVATIYMARPTPKGVWLETQLSTSIKMRNTDEEAKPATAWETDETQLIIDADITPIAAAP